MFKHAALAAAAGAALIALPAAAATTVTYPNGTGIVPTPNGPDQVDGPIFFRLTSNNNDQATFTAKFTFNNVFFDPAMGTATATFSTSDSDSVEFTGATLDGFSGDLVIVNDASGKTGMVSVWEVPINLGSHYVTISGIFKPRFLPVGPDTQLGNRTTSIGGTLTLNAVVPEPATWALFILGFGAIGHSMRRRSSKARVAKASLSFA